MRKSRMVKSITNGALNVQVHRKPGKHNGKTFACKRTDVAPRTIKVFKFDSDGMVKSIELVKPSKPRRDPYYAY